MIRMNEGEKKDLLQATKLVSKKICLYRKIYNESV